MTPAQIREFQHGRLDYEGKPLTVDGQLGPRTRWALGISRLPLVRQSTVRRFTKHLGLRETTPNDEPSGLIDGWLERAGAEEGSAWCAAFASWAISEPGDPPIRIAGAQKLGQRFPACVDPLPGDLMWYPTGAWQGHVEGVIAADATHSLCIGGNSANQIRLTLRLHSEVKYSRVVPHVGSVLYVPIPAGCTAPLVRVGMAGTR